MKRLFLLSGILLLAPGAVLGRQRPPVPAAPNEAVVGGLVIGYCVISSSALNMQPVIPIFRLDVQVETVRDVKGANFAKGMVGSLITLHSKERLSPELFDKKITVGVAYLGDEKGGRFWINGILEPRGRPQEGFSR